MRKVVTVDPIKCTGCRICELVCSFTHTGEFNPELSRIRVVFTENEGLLETVPLNCRTCEDAACERVCPTRAIYRSRETGALLVHERKCLGCMSCLFACPFGGTIIDFRKKISTRCDLCNGDPKCVEYCPTGSLEFQSVDKVAIDKIRGYVNTSSNQELIKLYEEIRPGSGTIKSSPTK